MLPELKQQWISALRSGKYFQVQEVLESEEGNCCLGVLCRVAGIKKLRSSKFARSDKTIGTASVFASNDNGISLLSPALLKKVGLTRMEQQQLWQLNDIEQWNFNQIADWIEKNIK